MKVLVVCSYRPYMDTGVAAFVSDQVESIRKYGIDVDYFIVNGHGFKGYLSNFLLLRKKISEYKPDVIHAHFGLCGVMSNLQRKVPVVTTYHGSDINIKKIYRLSKHSIAKSAYNIFVSQKMVEKAKAKTKYSVIPCGVNTDIFHPANKIECRKKLGMDTAGKYVLFSKMFGDPIKNYPLAKAAVDKLKGVELVEFIGYSRSQVPVLMNAVDAVIMTSFSEGSPQFIKEALACGTPVVSVDVGDVANLIDGVDNSYLCPYDADRISNCLEQAIAFSGISNGPNKIRRMNLDNITVAKKIIEIYENVVSERKN